MNKNIKKGRYPGQPDWMPDCEMYTRKERGGEFYMAPVIHTDRTICFTQEGMFSISLNELEVLYEPIYERQPRQFDACVCWDDKNKVIWYGIYLEARQHNWDNILIIKHDALDIAESERNIRGWLDYEKSGYCWRLK